MKQKPVIIYGRKKKLVKCDVSGQSTSSPNQEEAIGIGMESRNLDDQKKTQLLDLPVKLFSESTDNASESWNENISKKAGQKTSKNSNTNFKSKPRKERKKLTGNAVIARTEKKKPDSNLAPWAKAELDFADYEGYSLAVTTEKSAIENELSSQGNVEAIETEEPEPILECFPSKKIEASDAINGVNRLASTPAAAFISSHVIAESVKASPVLPESDENCCNLSDDVEAVGNAKLATPKLPVRSYNLRPLSNVSRNSIRHHSNSAALVVDMSDVSKSDSIIGNISKSMYNKDCSCSKTNIDTKSVRFEIPEISEDMRVFSSQSVTDNENIITHSLPSIIEGSSIIANSLDEMEETSPLDIYANGDRDNTIEFTDIMQNSFPVSPTTSFSTNAQSPKQERKLQCADDSILEKMPLESTGSIELKNAIDSSYRPPSPITNTTPNPSFLAKNTLGDQSYASELGDVVGDLEPINKTRFAKRISIPTDSTINHSSRLIDISMRRKSLLVHEISVTHSSQVSKGDGDILDMSRLSILTPIKDKVVSPFEKLLKSCEQSSVIPFEELFSPLEQEYCLKIGEGVAGEVFKIAIPEHTQRVIKIIPVNGTITFNDAEQKSFTEILTEVMISQKAAAFAKSAALIKNQRISRQSRMTRRVSRRVFDDPKTHNASPNFILVNKVNVVTGKFPSFLTKKWEEFSDSKGSENDHPERFDERQHFLIFDSVFGGKPLEDFKFKTCHQSLTLFAQVAVSLAVGEVACEFEHRDLHWGNILVHSTDTDILEYRIGKDRVAMESFGFEVSIIDFTLSRCSEDGIIVFTNISNDEGIFMGEGDFQFEVYRMMREECADNWASFTPRSNCFWLQYLLDKLLNTVRYPTGLRSNTKHCKSKRVLKKWFTDIQKTDSAQDFVKSILIPSATDLLSIQN